jgi:hypothetical protein
MTEEEHDDDKARERQSGAKSDEGCPARELRVRLRGACKNQRANSESTWRVERAEGAGKGFDLGLGEIKKEMHI